MQFFGVKKSNPFVSRKLDKDPGTLGDDEVALVKTALARTCYEGRKT